MARRTTERTRERDADEKDRIKEQEELDELKSKIFNGAFEDPTQEFERVISLQSPNFIRNDQYFKIFSLKRNAKNFTNQKS